MLFFWFSGHLRWINYHSRIPKGMICDHCEQLVPDKAKGRYKCVRCQAKYCSKEHQKAASKFHHRSCTRFPRDISPKNNNNLSPKEIQDEDQPEVVYGHSTNLSQNLNIAKYVVENLRKYGHCVLDNFHGEKIAKAVLNEVKSLHSKGSFNYGQLQSTTGHGTSNRRIREDEITWMNGNEDGCGNISHHMSITDTLLQLCNFFIKEHKIEMRSPVRFFSNSTFSVPIRILLLVFKISLIFYYCFGVLNFTEFSIPLDVNIVRTQSGFYSKIFL